MNSYGIHPSLFLSIFLFLFSLPKKCLKTSVIEHFDLIIKKNKKKNILIDTITIEPRETKGGTDGHSRLFFFEYFFG